MKFLKENGVRIVLLLAELAIGILLLIDPVGFTTVILTALGAVIAVLGVIFIIAYFRSTPQVGAAQQNLAKGTLCLIIGLFCAFNVTWLIATFPLLTILYGIATLISGVVKMQMTFDLMRLKKGSWLWCAIAALLTLICAIIILCNPFTATAALWTFVAISLIAEAAVDLVALCILKWKSRNNKNYV